MIKRPVLTSFLISACIALGVLAYALTTARNVDEKPFIAYFTLVAFPFGWFLVWIFTAALGWWLEIGEQRSVERTEPKRRDRSDLPP